MLGSITPLGERGRGQRYPVTVGAFLIGAGGGGALAGALLGGIGQLWVGGARAPALVALALAAVVGLALDLRHGGTGLPSVRRQVNEDWFSRYRGWVYGFGFGAQLGVGVLTIVTISTVYVCLLAALLSGSVLVGAAIGAVFGVARWLSALLGIRVVGPDGLARLAATIMRLDQPSRRVALVAQAAIVVALVAALAT